VNFKRNFILFSLIDLVGASIGLLTSPITTRLLSPTQYGAVPLLSSVWVMISVIQFAGMTLSYPFFGAHNKNGCRDKTLITTASFISFITLFIVCGIFFGIAMSTSWLRNFAEVSSLELGLFLATLPLGGIITWCLYILLYLHAAPAFVRLTILGKIAGALIGLPLMFFSSQPNRLIVHLGAGVVLQLLTIPIIIWEFRRIKLKLFTPNKFSSSLARKMLGYGAVLLPATMIYSTITMTDRLLVGWFAGPEEVALFALAASLSGAILMIKKWFSLVWSPHYTEWISTGDRELLQRNFRYALHGTSLIFSLLVCFSCFWNTRIVDFLYPPYYQSIVTIIPLLTLAGAFSAQTMVAGVTIIAAKSKQYYLPIYTVALIMNVIIGILTIPRWGAKGASLGTIAAELSILLSWILLEKRKFKNLALSWKLPSCYLIIASLLCVLFCFDPSLENIGNKFSFAQALAASLLTTIVFISLLLVEYPFQKIIGTIRTQLLKLISSRFFNKKEDLSHENI